MRIIIFTFCWFITLSSMCQVNLDSLYRVWQDETRPDSLRTNAYSDYIWDGWLYSRPDTALILAEQLVAFGKKRNYQKAQFAGYTLQGVSWENRSNYAKTLECYLKALEVATNMGQPSAIAIAYNNVGHIFHTKGDRATALEYYFKSLEAKPPENMTAGTLNNIGSIYLEQNNFARARENFEKSLALHRNRGYQQEIAVLLSKIGDVYGKEQDHAQALQHYLQSLQLFQKINDQVGIAGIFTDMGNIYEQQEDFEKAADYYHQSLGLYRQVGNADGIAVSMNNLGGIALQQGNYQQALEYCQEGFKIGTNIQSLARKRASCSCLYDAYKATGNKAQALKHLELLNALNDSLDTREAEQKLQEREFTQQAKLIQEAHEDVVRKKDKTRNISVLVGAFFLLLAGSFYLRWRYVRKSKAALQVEKDRSENLLLNILPEEIAQELKEKGKADAQEFDMVSILFTDFKNFTEQSALLKAAELVSDINDCFQAFDAIVEKYGIEKIKTIGDAYMAAGGLPVPSGNAVRQTVLAALEMQEYIRQRKAEGNKPGKHVFEMRAGIHTGPVVAGIVGVKKFQYDIWGDTVNTASRMESSGQVGRVNISQTTYELLKDDPEFEFESRGKVAAKGKGEVEMYFVRRKAAAL